MQGGAAKPAANTSRSAQPLDRGARRWTSPRAPARSRVGSALGKPCSVTFFLAAIPWSCLVERPVKAAERRAAATAPDFGCQTDGVVSYQTCGRLRRRASQGERRVRDLRQEAGLEVPPSLGGCHSRPAWPPRARTIHPCSEQAGRSQVVSLLARTRGEGTGRRALGGKRLGPQASHPSCAPHLSATSSSTDACVAAAEWARPGKQWCLLGVCCVWFHKKR